MDPKVEAIIGPVDPVVGLTPEQNWKLSHHMVGDTIEQMRDALGANADSYLLPKLWEKHWAFTTQDMTGAAINTWVAAALKVLLPIDARDAYTTWRRAEGASLMKAGFAGDRQPLLKFPSALTWYEASYAPGSYPTLVPVRDGLDTPLVKIKRVAILAVHKMSSTPFPDMVQYEQPHPAGEYWKAPDFLTNASLIVFIEDALGAFHTYAGAIAYGANGGALMWRVANAEQLTAAIYGEGPRTTPSNLAQFSAGEVGYLLHYYDNEEYETVKARVYGAPSPSEPTGDYNEQ